MFAGLNNSAMETVVGSSATTITADSWDLALGRGFADTSQPVSRPIETAIHWGSTIGGVADEIWLAIRPLQNMTAAGTLTWREYI